MKMAHVIASLAGVGLLGSAMVFVEHDVRAAKHRMNEPTVTPEPAQQAAVADYTEASYCTPQFKSVLARVVDACGLSGQEARRGCEPVDVKTFASITDEDFNALFDPLVKRGAILLFDDNSDKLDDDAKKLITDSWGDRKGAHYFFIVSRASKTGGADYNRALSQRRANSVFLELEGQTKEEGLEKKVGMLWLGSEYAQLSKDYCGTWKHTHPNKPCNAEAINRSSFISWVDCRL